MRCLLVEPGHEGAQPLEVGAQALDRHGLVQRSKPQAGKHGSDGGPRLDQPLLDARRDQVDSGCARLQARHRGVGQQLQLGQPAHHLAAARFDRLVRPKAVELPPEA